MPNGVLQHLAELLWCERNFQSGNNCFWFYLSISKNKQTKKQGKRLQFWKTKQKAFGRASFHIFVVTFLYVLFSHQILVPSVLPGPSGSHQEGQLMYAVLWSSFWVSSRDWWGTGSAECLPLKLNYWLFQSALPPPVRMQSLQASGYCQAARVGGPLLLDLVTFSHLQIGKLSINLSTG